MLIMNRFTIPARKQSFKWRCLLGMLHGFTASILMQAATHQVYVVTYTGNQSQGIYTFEWDDQSGESTSEVSLAASSENPSFLALHPNLPLLYAVNETSSFESKETGAVTAFRLSDQTTSLEPINQVASRGKAPCHIQVDASGKWVLVANYSSGTVAVLPIESNGGLGSTADVVEHLGSSVNPSRQEGPHAHCINLDPKNRFAVAADLGVDKLFAYPFEQATGHLNLYRATSISVKAGAGPRHFTFHPTLPFGYAINELNNTITAVAMDEDSGRMTMQAFQTIETLPEGYDETSYTAEIMMHPSGHFLYGSNRGHDSIAVFQIDQASGKLKLVELEPTQGKTPRSFGIDPAGRFLLAANQGSDTIVVFQIQEDSGALEPTGHTIKVPTPVCVVFR